MRQILLFILLVISVYSYATIRTVSNLPAGVAQFGTIQAAIDASADGDSILVHGSPNNYAGFTINGKKLVIIGPGWSPNKDLNFTARVAESSINGAGSSGTEIQGLQFIGNVNLTSSHPDNMRFIRNLFSGIRVHVHESGTYTGYLFEGNYFSNAQVYANNTNTSYVNFMFQNNWFTETACCFNGNISGFQNASNVLFNHNLFSGNGTGPRNVSETGSRFLSFSNNIFVRRDAATNISNSTFTNNLTFSSGQNAPWNQNGNVNSGGNVEDADPLMATTVANGEPSPTSDFTIASGPANNSATDGKDMGLLFDANGSLNWANSRNSRLPLIFSMNINTPTVSAGGNVQVTVEARRSN